MKHFENIVVLFAAGTILLASCFRDRNDQPSPNYNNNYYNNTHGIDSTASVYDEEFNGADNSNWAFTNVADSNYGVVSNGMYEFVDYSNTYYPISVVFTNVSVSGNFMVQTKIESTNMMGLIFGASPTDNGYAFYVDSNGYFSVYKEGIGSIASVILVPSTQDTLHATKKGWNILEVDQVSGTWTGYINGYQAFTMAAQPVAGSGFGFKIAPATTGYSDYLIVKKM